jgi:hypothetical protein
MPDSRKILYEISGYCREVETWEKTFTIKYPRLRDFFYSLKKTGSGTPLNGQTLALGQMRKLIREWTGELAGAELEMTYNICYIMAVK